MAKASRKAGSTSTIFEIFAQDSSSTTGAGLTGLVASSPSLTCYYKRDTATSPVAVTLVSVTTLGTFVSSGFNPVDGTNMPGVYEFHPPNAALAAGAKSVVFFFKGATNLAPLPLEVELTATDNQDGVRGGMTAMPNAAAEAAGGLYTRGSGAGQINQSANGQIDVNAERLNNVAQSLLDLKDFADAGYDPATDKVQGVVLVDTLTTYTGNTPQTGDSFARIGAAGASLTDLGGMSAAMKAQVQTEAEDALVVHRLDELLNADSDIDGLAPPTVGSVFHELLTKTAGSFTYDQATDSLEAIRDRGDVAWITATGFSTHSAADVWASVTRLLTGGDNIVLAKGVGVTGFTDLSAAQVNAEVVDALNVDTYTEPGQGTPPATATIVQRLQYLYKAWRNRQTQTASQYTLYADNATTVDQKATFSDDATTADRGEVATGP